MKRKQTFFFEIILNIIIFNTDSNKKKKTTTIELSLVKVSQKKKNFQVFVYAIIKNYELLFNLKVTQLPTKKEKNI